MLEVATAVRAEHSLHTEELDIAPSSHHTDDSSAGKKAESPSPVASERPASPNDYTPTDEVQTSRGDKGNLDLHGLTREVLKLKKQTAKQAAQILRLKIKIKTLVKKVKPVIAEYSSFVKLKATLSKKKKLKKAHKKKSSSFKQERKKVSDGSTGLNEDDVNSGDSQIMDGDDTISAEVHEGTAQVNEGTAEVHEGTAEVNESTAGANLSTEPLMKEVEDEAGPSTFQDKSDEYRRAVNEGRTQEGRRPYSSTIKSCSTANDEEVARKVAAEWKKRGKKKLAKERIVTEEQKANFWETIAAQGDLEQSNKPRFEEANLHHFSLRNQMIEVKRINDKFVAIGSTEDEQAIQEMNVKAEEPSRKRKGTIRKMKSSRIIKKRKLQKSDDELKDFLKVVNFENNCAQDIEVMEQHSLISRFSIVQSPEGEYIAVQRANGHIRAFNTLNEVLHILDIQDLYHLHRLVIEYYEHIPLTGLGLILHGDLTTMMETTEESDDELWRNQTEWEIIRWRLYESTGVHILELENGRGSCGKLDAQPTPDEGVMVKIRSWVNSGHSIRKHVNALSVHVANWTPFVSILDGDMTFLRKKGKYGAALGNLFAPGLGKTLESSISLISHLIFYSRAIATFLEVLHSKKNRSNKIELLLDFETKVIMEKYVCISFKMTSSGSWNSDGLFKTLRIRTKESVIEMSVERV
ncbi:hypothetical protein Tco_1107570 [Tanacetum coccineum]